MSKKVIGSLRLIIPSGKANPSPPVGPALGQRGVNIMEFCKQFNERTKQYKDSIPLPVQVTVFQDKSFTFIIKTPPVSYFLKHAAGIVKGSSQTVVAKLSLSALYEIAQIKKQDPAFLHLSESTLVKMLMGSAKSMGIQIES
uniref:Large ribosomal subunit protein uL11m n=1 Tax=Andalucia godoyi TaxID=505711 RepID=M4Q9C9_ANDGO|nr:ribosomal protein L11 [Andalucia godoyi]AGH23966.1 ribosomal protein L11 [Andalucia godoyi]